MQRKDLNLMGKYQFTSKLFNIYFETDSDVRGNEIDTDLHLENEYLLPGQNPIPANLLIASNELNRGFHIEYRLQSLVTPVTPQRRADTETTPTLRRWGHLAGARNLEEPTPNPNVRT